MTHTVLIVDDEPIILRSLQSSVDWRSLDCEVIGAAEDGEEALAIMRRRVPDIVLTDIAMPGMNGIELLRAMADFEPRPEVVILSGYSDFEYAREGIQHRAFDYILKPIDPDQLTACIRRIKDMIERREKQRHTTLKQLVYDALMLGIAPGTNEPPGPYRVAVAEFASDGVEAVPWSDARQADASGLMRFVFRADKRRHVLVFQGRPDVEGFDADSLVELGRLAAGCGPACRIASGPVTAELGGLVASYEECVRILELLAASSLPESMEQRVWTLYEAQHSSQRRTSAEQIGQAMDFMIRHYREDIGIEAAAEAAQLSVSHFSALLKQRTGLTFLEHLTELRIRQACLLLSDTNLKTYEVANRVGYADQRYFSQVFKRKMNMTPSEYRAQAQSDC